MFIVSGLIINFVILDPQALPSNLRQSLEWFQQNPDASSNVILSLYILAGVMAVTAVLLSISLVRSKKGGEDTKMGRKIRRLAR